MKKNGSNTLSILSLIFGIIGLVMSCVLIGIIPSIAGLVLGIIALAKGQAKGSSITGIVCSSIGILICFIVVSGEPSTAPSSTTSGTFSSNVTNVNKPKSSSDSLADMIDAEVYYFESLGSTYAFVVVTNNSDTTVDIDTNVYAKDTSGNILSTYSSNEMGIGPGQSYPLLHYFEDVSINSINKVDYSLTATKSYYSSLVGNGFDSSIENTTESGVIIKATNNSKDDIYFPKATALFFNDGILVGFGDTYLDNVSTESALQSGQTVVRTIDCLHTNTFDNVKVYYHVTKY